MVAIFSDEGLAEVFIYGSDDEAVETVGLMLGGAAYELTIKNN